MAKQRLIVRLKSGDVALNLARDLNETLRQKGIRLQPKPNQKRAGFTPVNVAGIVGSAGCAFAHRGFGSFTERLQEARIREVVDKLNGRLRGWDARTADGKPFRLSPQEFEGLLTRRSVELTAL